MNKGKILPEIRFNEFTEYWEDIKLGRLFDVSSASRVHKAEWKNKGVPFFRTSDVIAIFNNKINKKTYISKELYETLSLKSGKVCKDDILITGGGSIGIPYLIKDSQPIYFKDADLLWLKNSGNLNGYFLYTYFLTNIFRKYLASISHIGTISHYTIEQVKDTPMNIPLKKEQDKLGDFFTKLDKIILLQQQLLNDHKQLKKAMLQKMLPQKGEIVPEVRFTGFTDNWESRKIEDMFEVTRGKVLAATKVLNKKTNQFQYPVYSSQTKNNGLLGFYKDYLFDTAITWTTDGANAGTVNFREGKFYSTNVNGVLLSKEGYANKAVSEILNKIAWKFVSKVGNPKLMNNIMSDIFITVPSLGEQLKISDFFEQLDETIDLHQKKLETYQELKKAMLQKMFV